MQVLVVGAAGNFAGLVVPELKKRGVKIRALVRSEAQAARARERGADETTLGDLEDPGSLCTAADGVDGVFHMGPAFAPNESDMGIAMVEAARAADVRRFVFSSVIHPFLSALSNHAAKLPVEETLCQSGMNFTILQPAIFMQNLESAWSEIVRRRRFALPYSAQRRACYIDYRDVAEAAAIAFTSDRMDYGTFELCAPGMLDRYEVAALMSKAAGFTIEAGEISFEEWARISKLPRGPVRDGLKRMYEGYEQHGFPGGNSLVLESVLGRPPRSFREYLEELARVELTQAA